MTGEPSVEPPSAGTEANGEARSRRAASEVAALVETQVRDAIAGAERAADEVRRQALDDASADRATVRDMAGQVLARIGELEERVVRLFGDLRAEAQQVAEAVDSPGDTPDRSGTENARIGDAEPTHAAATREEDRPGTPAPAGAVADEASVHAEEVAAPQESAAAETQHGAEPALRPAAEGLAWTETAVAGPEDQAADSAPGGAPPTGGADASPADSAGARPPADRQAAEGWPAPDRTTRSERFAVPRPAASPADEEEGVTGGVRDEAGDAVRPPEAAEQQSEDAASETAGRETQAEPMAWPAGQRAGATSREEEREEPRAVVRRRRGLFRHRRDG
jgi:hypothetical protein